MGKFKLIDSEMLERNDVIEFSRGPVTISERETREVYRFEEATKTRLVVVEAIERTLDLIAKTRAEFAELNSILLEFPPK